MTACGRRWNGYARSAQPPEPPPPKPRRGGGGDPAGFAKIGDVGFLDALTGRRKLAAPARDRLFAISTAYVTLEAEHGITTRGAAAIVFQPLATTDFESIVKDTEEIVRATAAESATSLERSDDAYGFRWLVLRGRDFEGLVVGVNAVSSAIEAGGYGERLLCAVFAFEDPGQRGLYWIYNYKRGSFYPFVPAGGREQRDTERELVLQAQMTGELPIEPELGRWFPLWGIPI
jgi:hypothetical protein